MSLNDQQNELTKSEAVATKRKPNPEIERLQREVDSLRSLVVELTPGRFPALLDSFVYDDRHQLEPSSVAGSGAARGELLDLIVEAADAAGQADIFGAHRASCPLCEAIPSSGYSEGFTVPTGLERHLSGEGTAPCKVLESIDSWVRERYERRPKRGRAHSPTEAPSLSKPMEPAVQADESQSHLEEKAITLWKITSVDEPTSRYSRHLRFPTLVKWVRGPKEEAVDIQAFWVKTLRWQRATERTRIWLGRRDPRGVWLGNCTLNAPDEAVTSPTWDPEAREWVGPEPVIVDLRHRYWLRFMSSIYPSAYLANATSSETE